MADFRGAYSGAVVNPMGSFDSLSSYARAVDAAGRQDRAHEINMRELEYLAGRQALGVNQQGGSGAGGASDKWLAQWDKTLQASQGVYNKALQAFDGSYAWMQDAKASADRLGDLASTFEGEYDSFRKDFSGIEGQFREQATSELGSRRRMGEQLEGLATADYEGAAGQAMADVAQQAESGRQADARRMMSMGIDPSSKRGQAMMRRYTADEATGKAVAANMARRGEKERVTALTGQAMQLFDPNAMAGTAMQIRQGGNAMLTQAGQLRQSEAATKGSLAGMQGQIAQGIGQIGTGMAQNIASQQADVGGLFAGIEYGQNQNVSGNINVPSTNDMFNRRSNTGFPTPTNPAVSEPEAYGAGSYFNMMG